MDSRHNDVVLYNMVISQLRSKTNKANVAGMARFGINTEKALGISVTELRGFAKRIGKNHGLAGKLWGSQIHEARILAGMVEEPEKVTEKQLDMWAAGFDSWDLCDQCCSNMIDKTPYAYRKATEWCKDEREFVKRAGYTMMAVLAVHDKEASDARFISFLSLIKAGATDKRNFVKKSVNWALRQIGKRNEKLRRLAIATSYEIKKIGTGSARWIASDALRELEDKKDIV